MSEAWATYNDSTWLGTIGSSQAVGQERGGGRACRGAGETSAKRRHTTAGRVAAAELGFARCGFVWKVFKPFRLVFLQLAFESLLAYYKRGSKSLIT